MSPELGHEPRKIVCRGLTNRDRRCLLGMLLEHSHTLTTLSVFKGVFLNKGDLLVTAKWQTFPNGGVITETIFIVQGEN